MERLPFDPMRAAGASTSTAGQGPSDSDAGQAASRQRRDANPAADASSGGGGVLTPSGLAQQVEWALNDAFPKTLKLRGEVSNFRARNHWYFAIKDADATIACTCWASTARKQPVVLEDGQEVIVHGRVAFYGPQGKFQLIVSKVEPVGRGALEAELKRRADQLRKAGYFDRQGREPLPWMPRFVAVVTSRTAAALQDVLDTARRRWPGVKLGLFDVRVQGDQAAGEVARAIDAIGWGADTAAGRQQIEAGLRPGAVIVTRGGGSMEDLWAFNEMVVCEAVHRCPIPVVAAIGHETDTTLAELCADQRAATPTQAATLLVPEKDRLQEQLRQTQDRLRLTVQRRVSVARQQLDALARHPMLRRPDAPVTQARQQLDQLAVRLQKVLAGRIAAEREHLRLQAASLARSTKQQLPDRNELDRLDKQLARALHRRLDQAKQQTKTAEQRLAAISPNRVLDRGFSYTLGPDGQLLTDAAQAGPGQKLTTVLANGRIDSRVLGGGEKAEPAPAANDAALSSPAEPATELSSQPTTDTGRSPRTAAKRKRPTRKPPSSKDTDQPKLF